MYFMYETKRHKYCWYKWSIVAKFYVIEAHVSNILTRSFILLRKDIIQLFPLIFNWFIGFKAYQTLLGYLMLK